MVVVDDTSTYICICILAFIHPQGCFMYLLIMLLNDLEQYIILGDNIQIKFLLLLLL